MEKQKVGYTYDGILFPHKKEESLQTATTWMDLEDIRLSEISLSQEDKYCQIPLN